MIKFNLQLFGGRGGGSSMSGGGGPAVGGVTTGGGDRKNKLMREVDKTGFVSEGRGHWTLDTGAGGASILDETGGSRDPMHGMGGKVYSVSAWDAGFNRVMDGQLFDGLNAAKQAAKQAIKDSIV